MVGVKVIVGVAVSEGVNVDVFVGEGVAVDETVDVGVLVAVGVGLQAPVTVRVTELEVTGAAKTESVKVNWLIAGPGQATVPHQDTGHWLIIRAG